MRKMTAFVVAMAWLGTAAAADVYCDHERKTCSDLPFAGAERVHIQTTGQSSAESSSSTTSSGTTPVKTTSSNDAAAKAAVQKDIADARAEQCKKAQEAYQQTIAARRIYKEGKDGERDYLTDEEADKLRMDSRTAMDSACGTSTSAQ
ncbi:MAG TPA: hypothetical protein VMI92_08750 [Steroidobacteraceae bacterium]|nr:hypothetical protein [Steroidobacteraceae bacterium]